MKCRVCGTEIEDGIKKCSVCGTVVDTDGSLNEAVSSISSLAKALRANREKFSQRIKSDNEAEDNNIEDLYVKNMDYGSEIIEKDDDFDINAFYEETKDMDDADVKEEPSKLDNDDKAADAYDNTEDYDIDENNDDYVDDDNNEIDSSNSYNEDMSNDKDKDIAIANNSYDATDSNGGFSITFDNGDETETYQLSNANNKEDVASESQPELVEEDDTAIGNDDLQYNNTDTSDFVSDGYLKETDFVSDNIQDDDNSGDVEQENEGNYKTAIESVDDNSDIASDFTAIEPQSINIENTGAIGQETATNGTAFAKIDVVKVPADQANQPFDFVMPGTQDANTPDTTTDGNDTITPNAEDAGVIKAENIPYTQLPEVKSSVSDTNPIVINPKDVVDSANKTDGEKADNNKQNGKGGKAWGVISLILMIIAGLGCIVLFSYILFLQNMTDANAVFQFVIDLFANTSILAYFALGVFGVEILAVIFAIVQIIVNAGKFAKLVIIFNIIILIAMSVGLYLTKTFELILNVLGIA